MKRLFFIIIFSVFIILFLLFGYFQIFQRENSSIVLYNDNHSINETTKTISGFSRPFGINFDSEGNIYIADFEKDYLLKYDENFNFLENVGSGFDRPHSVDFDEEGNLYVTEFGNKKISILSPDGEFISVLNSPKELEGPATAYFDKEYNLYISDYGSNSLLKFSSEGEFIGWIGAKSDGKITNGWETFGYSIASSVPGGFDRLHMARVDSDGNIYVADTWNNRIQKFSSDGKFIGWIGMKSDGKITNGWEMSGKSSASSIEGGFNTPISIDFTVEGDLIIFEFENGRIQKFSKEGVFLETVAEGFNHGYDAKIYHGKLYVVDTGNKLIKVLFQ